MTTTEDDDDGSLARALEEIRLAMTRASSFAASRGREREDEARDDAEETSGGGERDDDDDDESDDATWESESEEGEARDEGIDAKLDALDALDDMRAHRGEDAGTRDASRAPGAATTRLTKHASGGVRPNANGA